MKMKKTLLQMKYQLIIREFKIQDRVQLFKEK